MPGYGTPHIWFEGLLGRRTRCQVRHGCKRRSLAPLKASCGSALFTAVCPQPLSRSPRGMEPVCPFGAGAGFNAFCALAAPNAIEREKKRQLLPMTIILSPMHTQKNSIAVCLYFHRWRATSTCRLYLGYVEPRASVTLRNVLYQHNWGRLKSRNCFLWGKAWL